MRSQRRRGAALCVEQAADPGTQPGGLTGQIVVEPDQHRQLGKGLVIGVDLPQCVEQAAGGDDDRIPGASVLALPG